MCESKVFYGSCQLFSGRRLTFLYLCVISVLLHFSSLVLWIFTKTIQNCLNIVCFLSLRCTLILSVICGLINSKYTPWYACWLCSYTLVVISSLLGYFFPFIWAIFVTILRDCFHIVVWVYGFNLHLVFEFTPDIFSHLRQINPRFYICIIFQEWYSISLGQCSCT